MSEKDKKSISYYLAGLTEAREQKNTESCIFFIQKIIEINSVRISGNQIVFCTMIVFIILNFFVSISNAYMLFLK